MNKVAVTRCLREAGASLDDAFRATNRVLEGERVTVQLRRGVDVESVKQRLRELGTVVG